MQYRITTAQQPPVTFLYAEAPRALRKVKTLQHQGVAFTLTDEHGVPVPFVDVEPRK